MKITSAKDALIQNKKLKSIWSKESQLTQLILIYIAELLETKCQKKKRRLSKWVLHLQRCLRAGKTMQQASTEWKARLPKAERGA